MHGMEMAKAVEEKRGMGEWGRRGGKGGGRGGSDCAMTVIGVKIMPASSDLREHYRKHLPIANCSGRLASGCG